MRFAFWVFVVDFFYLMYLGSQHAEEPFVTLGAIATALYFGWFVVILPVVGVIENTLMDIATNETK
jgi:ubiquinol-cytochrome c reductase cytochrome b subunit